MHPSFFKIFLEPSSPHLALPPDFVSLHLKNKIPKDPIIQSENGGYSWKLKMKKIGESYCFTNGWDNVVKDVELVFGDFIFFRLVGQSIFKMWIYSPNGCEKLLLPKVQHDEDDDNDDESHDVEDDYSFDDDYVNDDEDDEEKNEENADDEDKDPVFMAIITKQFSKLLRFPAEFAELAGINAEGTMIVKNLEGKEWVTGLRLDKSYRSSIRYYLSNKWRVFLRENGLSEGDECVFKFIRSEGKLLLAKVTKKK